MKQLGGGARHAGQRHQRRDGDRCGRQRAEHEQRRRSEGWIVRGHASILNMERPSVTVDLIPILGRRKLQRAAPIATTSGPKHSEDEALTGWWRWCGLRTCGAKADVVVGEQTAERDPVNDVRRTQVHTLDEAVATTQSALMIPHDP